MSELNRLGDLNLKWSYRTATGCARIAYDPIADYYLAFFNTDFVGSFAISTVVSRELHRLIQAKSGTEVPVDLARWEVESEHPPSR